MKLQFKLVLYNTVTKAAIITVLIALTIAFIDKISLNHLKGRLIEKRNRLAKDLSESEINELLDPSKTFTDYNILKEEYIVLTELPGSQNLVKEHFTREEKKVDDNIEEYLILTDELHYNNKFYRLEIGESTVSFQRLEKTIIFYTILILGVSIVLTFFTDLAFANFLLAPFYRIMDLKLNKVNDPTHYDHTPIKTSTSDFALLDESISKLITKITALFDNEKQFIANVSHELLTPISVLRTRLENMLSDESLSEKGQNKVVACLNTLSMLKGIINSLLLISKIENQQFLINDDVNIQIVLDHIYTELEDRIRSKKILYKNALRHNITFRANEPLIHTMLSNLITNAIKYNKQGGSITITDDLQENNYILSIKDSGVGMSDDFVKRAFRRFEKIDPEKEESHGLGLAIVKSIADFHAIAVDVTSSPEQGAEFRLSLNLIKNTDNQ